MNVLNGKFHFDALYIPVSSQTPSSNRDHGTRILQLEFDFFNLMQISSSTVHYKCIKMVSWKQWLHFGCCTWQFITQCEQWQEFVITPNYSDDVTMLEFNSNVGKQGSNLQHIQSTLCGLWEDMHFCKKLNLLRGTRDVYKIKSIMALASVLGSLATHPKATYDETSHSSSINTPFHGTKKIHRAAFMFSDSTFSNGFEMYWYTFLPSAYDGAHFNFWPSAWNQLKL